MLVSEPWRSSTRQELTEKLEKWPETTIPLLNQDYIARKKVSLFQTVERWQAYWSQYYEAVGLTAPVKSICYTMANVEIVPMLWLRSIQNCLEVSALIKLLSGDGLSAASASYERGEPVMPWGVSRGPCFYLMDGHHRMWLAAALGQSYTPLRIFDMAYYLRRYPVPEEKTCEILE